MTRAYFADTGSSVVDAIPGQDIDLVLEATTTNPRPQKFTARLHCPLVPSMHGKDYQLRATNARPGQTTVLLPVPQKFDTLPIEVEIEPSGGGLVGRFASDEATYKQRLIIRQIVPATLDVTVTPEVKAHLDNIAKISGTIVTVPNIDENVAITPIVGDISSSPKVAIHFPTTMDIPIQFICDERILRDLRGNADHAIRLLEKVSEDQSSLRFFMEQFRIYLEQQGATAETGIDNVHLKVGPRPVMMYYATQVSPSEDNAVIAKIDSVAATAKEHDAQVTLVVKDLDESLLAIAEKHQMNVVDIFTGVEKRATILGDQVIAKFVEDKLDKEIGNYVVSPKGPYSANTFKELLDRMG